MSDLVPITPLGGSAPQVDRIGALTITENPGRALASMTARLGHEAQVQSTANAFLGLALPEPQQSAAGDAYFAFWIGPDSWMVDAPYAGNERIAQVIKSALGDAVSVVEQTDGWCRFDVEGETVADLFERLCPADVRAAQPGWVTRTTIHHLGCFLIRQDRGWSVLGPRSSAGSLHHALIEAAHSVG